MHGVVCLLPLLRRCDRPRHGSYARARELRLRLVKWVGLIAIHVCHPHQASPWFRLRAGPLDTCCPARNAAKVEHIQAAAVGLLQRLPRRRRLLRRLWPLDIVVRDSWGFEAAAKETAAAAAAACAAVAANGAGLWVVEKRGDAAQPGSRDVTAMLSICL